jgi:putative NADPH-quinone reductase
MADSYAKAAESSKHQVRRIELAKLDFPLLRTQKDFETGELPPNLVQARDDLRWAQHSNGICERFHKTVRNEFYRGR